MAPSARSARSAPITPQLLPTDPTHRLNALELGGGALLDLGIYPISFVWDMLGAPTDIRAVGRLIETGADSEVATVMTHEGGAISTTLSSSRASGPNAASIIGTQARIASTGSGTPPTTFRVTLPDGTVQEEYVSEVDGRGMQFQALAAERLVRDGILEGDILPIAESVATWARLMRSGRRSASATPVRRPDHGRDQPMARVAVYLDFDNIVISWYDRVHGRKRLRQGPQRITENPNDPGRRRAPQPGHDRGRRHHRLRRVFGTLVLTRAYADWSSPVNAVYRSQLVARAVDLVQLFPARRLRQERRRHPARRGRGRRHVPPARPHARS